MHRVTIYLKPNSPACQTACRAIELSVPKSVPVVIEKIDITGNTELLEKYGSAVPVVVVDGQERFRGAVDPDKLGNLFYNDPGSRLAGIE
ncbi:MAG: glutaredoxin family protein [Phycisphaerae bacterium]